jgi:hypothetical protein
MAYYLWQQRGCPEGNDQEDWFEAERIVLGLRASTLRDPVFCARIPMKRILD